MNRERLIFEARVMTALWTLDLLRGKSVSEWATRLVAGELEHDSLVALASCSGDDGQLVGGELSALLQELGAWPMSDRDMAMCAVTDISRRLGEGDLEPIEAARMIWKVARRAPSSEEQLRLFIGLASQWEDDSSHRSEYEDEIRARALRLAE